jgi:hypothetical protein
LTKYDVKVNAKTLKQATKAALGLPNSTATFKLTAKVLTELFTPEELAASRGQGLQMKKETDFCPALDSHSLQILKGFENCIYLGSSGYTCKCISILAENNP